MVGRSAVGAAAAGLDSRGRFVGRRTACRCWRARRIGRRPHLGHQLDGQRRRRFELRQQREALLQLLLVGSNVVSHPPPSASIRLTLARKRFCRTVNSASSSVSKVALRRHHGREIDDVRPDIDSNIHARPRARPDRLLLRRRVAATGYGSRRVRPRLAEMRSAPFADNWRRFANRRRARHRPGPTSGRH